MMLLQANQNRCTCCFHVGGPTPRNFAICGAVLPLCFAHAPVCTRLPGARQGVGRGQPRGAGAPVRQRRAQLPELGVQGAGCDRQPLPGAGGHLAGRLRCAPATSSIKFKDGIIGGGAGRGAQHEEGHVLQRDALRLPVCFAASHILILLSCANICLSQPPGSSYSL